MAFKEIVAIDLINEDGEVSQRIELNKDSIMWKMCNCGFGEKSYEPLVNENIFDKHITITEEGAQNLLNANEVSAADLKNADMNKITDTDELVEWLKGGQKS